MIQHTKNPANEVMKPSLVISQAPPYSCMNETYLLSSQQNAFPDIVAFFYGGWLDRLLKKNKSWPSLLKREWLVEVSLSKKIGCRSSRTKYVGMAAENGSMSTKSVFNAPGVALFGAFSSITNDFTRAKKRHADRLSIGLRLDFVGHGFYGGDRSNFTGNDRLS